MQTVSCCGYRTDTMGGYYDDIYRLENGSFICEHTGRYGAEGGDWQTIDFYEWDGERVSQSAYETYLAAAVDTDGAVNLTRGGISAQEVLKQLGADVEEPSDSGFSDVPAGAWFADAVEYVSQNGMMNGTNSNRFSPNGLDQPRNDRHHPVSLGGRA